MLRDLAIGIGPGLLPILRRTLTLKDSRNRTAGNSELAGLAQTSSEPAGALGPVALLMTLRATAGRR